MSFKNSDLDRVIKLARLSVDDESKDQLAHEIQEIIAFVEQLNELDVSSLEPMAHAGETTLSLRDDLVLDVVGKSCFSSSLGYDDGLVRVPKIIE
jgi:aspartyl-tRNA(Asn)/glutamyl-tRNA(Gln) amidotransferase subunit C